MPLLQSSHTQSIFHVLFSCLQPGSVFCVQGYDMEDAMVVNKSSKERGFAYGSIYKSEVECSNCIRTVLCIVSVVAFCRSLTYLRKWQEVSNMEMSNTSLTDLVMSSLTLWINEELQVICVLGIGDEQLPNIEPDGLPAVGSVLNQGDPLYWLDN